MKYANDITLHSKSINILRSNLKTINDNNPEVLSGIWRGKALRLTGMETVRTVPDRNYCGYRPVEEAPVELWVFDGDKIQWESGTPEYFECLWINR